MYICDIYSILSILYYEALHIFWQQLCIYRMNGGSSRHNVMNFVNTDIMLKAQQYTTVEYFIIVRPYIDRNV